MRGRTSIGQWMAVNTPCKSARAGSRCGLKTKPDASNPTLPRWGCWRRCCGRAGGRPAQSGGPPETAGDLARAITEWVGSAKRPVEELLAEYQMAGLDYGPPGAPLESLDGLSRGRGMADRK